MRTTVHFTFLLAVAGHAATIMPPDFWANTCTESGCSQGSTWTLSSAIIDVPDDLNQQLPNIGDYWEERADDAFDETYTLLITGGTGTGVLSMYATLSGRGTMRGAENGGSGSWMYSPFAMGMRPFGMFDWFPDSMIDEECPACGVEFTYGVPFNLQIRSTSVATYSYGRGPSGLDALLPGTPDEQLWLSSQATIALRGVYSYSDLTGYSADPGASISAAPAVSSPEPATGLLAGVLMCLLLLTRRYGLVHW